MVSNKGSTTVFITILCMVVLGLGTLVGWQWHRSQMESVLLENLKLEKEVEDCKTSVCPLQTEADKEATPASQSAAGASDLVISVSPNPSKPPPPPSE